MIIETRRKITKIFFSPFQIRLIHKSDYTLEERLMFKPIVFANTIQSMSIILHAVERLGKLLESVYC